MPPRKDADDITKVQQNSLGADALVRKWRHKYGKSDMEREVTRQFLYLDEEEDFNPENHKVGEAERRRIQRGDLTDANEFHVSQGEELGDEDGENLVQEAPEAIAQFEADVRDKTRTEKFRAKTRVGSQQTVNAIKRATMARGVGLNEEKLRASLTQTSIPAYKRLAAAQTLARLDRDRRAIASMPELPLETQAVRDARTAARVEHEAAVAAGRPEPQENDTQAISIAELQRMLTLDPFPSLERTIQTGLLDLPDVRSISDYLQPRLFEREHDKKHENALEVIMNMRAAGAHWEEIMRIAVPTRLALALDPVHYGDYIVRGEESAHDAVLIGGHEHYDERLRITTLIVMKFWTVRKTKSNNNNKVVQKAKRLLGGVDVADDVERDRQGTDTTVRPRALDGEDDDEVDAYDDTDDYYDGGSDLKNPRNHFMCCVRVVFVEARECLHKDDTGHITTVQMPIDDTPVVEEVAPKVDEFDNLFLQPTPPTAAVPLVTQEPEFAYADPETEEDRKANETAAPRGTMVVTQQVAMQLAGKYRYRKLMGWLNGPKRPAGDGALGDSRQLGPLCFRAYNISSE